MADVQGSVAGTESLKLQENHRGTCTRPRTVSWGDSEGPRGARLWSHVKFCRKEVDSPLEQLLFCIGCFTSCSRQDGACRAKQRIGHRYKGNILFLDTQMSVSPEEKGAGTVFAG